MDTRQKILDPATAAATVPPGTLVLGYFDPLTATEAARLEALGSGLTVAVLDPPDPLLPARARAELVAALHCVAHVIAGPPPADLRPVHTIDETAAHLASRQALTHRIVSSSNPK